MTGRHSPTGFTLVEAMVASMILLLVMGPSWPLGRPRDEIPQRHRRTARSSQVLQQKMEDVRLCSWSQMQTLPATFTDPRDTAGIYAGKIRPARTTLPITTARPPS